MNGKGKFEPLTTTEKRYYNVPAVTTIAWGSISSTGGTPSTNATIDITQATTLCIQVDTTHASNTSASTDINIYSSPNNVNFDNAVYTSVAAVGSAVVTSATMCPGPGYLKFTVDNNTGASLSYGTARILMRT